MGINKTTHKQFRTLRRRRLALALAGAMAMPAAFAQSLPDTGNVVSGTATIGQTGTQMTITQSSQGAIIDWNGFSIDAGYGVTFDQQFGTTSVTLNRVVGASPSLINGSLSANGSVFIINPAGITFGGTAQVSVGGLVAATMDISNANFNSGVGSGHYQFEPMTTTGNQTISVDAGGTITTDAAGTVALLGRQVSNSGTITAPGGSVLFGSAETITLDFQGDGLTMLTLQGPGIAKPGAVACPSLPCPGPVNPLLVNAGTITADGGQILLRTAATAVGGGGDIINIGTLRAQSLVSRNGRIELTTDLGVVSLGYSSSVAGGFAGTVDVSGQSGAGGGTVLVRAGDFAMFNNDSNPLNPSGPSSVGSVIDASGDVDGGTVDIQVANAATLYSLSSIRADGANGQGGQVSLAADTLAFGAQARISANGGAGAGGNLLLSGTNGLSLYGLLQATGSSAGGTIGTSTNADSFDLRGLRVEAGSPGAAGTWTLGVPSLTVINGSDAGELDGMLGGNTLQDAELNHALGYGTSVVINAKSDVYFRGAQILAGSAVPQLLQVNADGRIGGSGFSIGSLAAPLDMHFNADASGANAGVAGIDFGSGNFDSHGGDILMYGQSDAANGFASDESHGIQLYDVNILTGGGNLLLRGDSTGAVVTSGDAGVSLYQTTIDTGGGQVTLMGTGANAASGVYVRGDSIRIDAGAIDINGTASGSGDGVAIFDVGLVTSAGDIHIVGAGGGRGVVWSDYGSGMLAYGGAIYVHGTGSQGNGTDLTGTIDSGGGAITLYGNSKAGTGLHFDAGYSGTLVSGGGDISLTGIGAFAGVALVGSSYASSIIDSGSGAIDVSGIASGSGGTGVALDAIQVQAGGGAITLYGIDTDGAGVQFTSGGGVTTTTGDILVSSVGLFVGLGLYGGEINTGSGNIDLRGRGIGTDASGLVIGQYTNLVSNGGDILLSGEGLGGAGVRIDSFANVDAGSGIVVLRAANDGNSDAAIIDGAIHSTTGVNLRPGGVDLNGIAYDRVNDAILLGSGTGFALDDAELDRIAAPELVIGSQQHAGAIQVTEAVTHAGNLTLQNGGGSGGIDLRAGIDVGTYNLALLSGGTISQTAAAPILAHSLLATAGGDVLLDAAGNDVASTTLAGSAGGDFRFLDGNDLAIGNVSAAGFDATSGAFSSVGIAGITATGNVQVQNQSGNLTLNAGITGADILLATAGTLQNTAAASLNASGNWQVWAATWVGELRGGLGGSGTLPNLYGCAYLGACGVTVGSGENHFIYAQQPTLFITIDDAVREYGLANPSFAYSATGLILGDSLANAIAGAPTTVATQGSDVGSYIIGSGFTSAAGYQIQFATGTLSITPATLMFTADPFVRFLGLPNPDFTGTITGFRNGDTAQSVFGTAIPWYSPAGSNSPVGYYPIIGGASAKNYVFVQAPGNATALRIVPPQLPDVPVTIVGDTPNTYVYDRNFGGAPACAVNASLDDQRLAGGGDMLSTEWSKVRTRPNLTNCFDSERRSACGDF